jgi:winged helix-turn-helix protein
MALDRQTIDQPELDALVGKAVSELAAGYSGVMIDIGARLGLYKAMAGMGPMTSGEVARAAGCAERYVREWLNGQVAGGYVAYHPDSRTYELTPEQAVVLADDTSPVFMPAVWEIVAAAWADAGQTMEAIRTGKGVSWGDMTAGCIAASPRSSATATAPASSRNGCPPSTASSPSSRPGRASPTWVAVTATRRS